MSRPLPSLPLHEADRIPRGIAWGTLGFFVGFGALLALLAWLFFSSAVRLQPPSVRPDAPPPPRAPVAIARVRLTLIEDERPGLRGQRDRAERLERWGWVDRQRGIVHMPVEVAMELVLQEEGHR